MDSDFDGVPLEALVFRVRRVILRPVGHASEGAWIGLTAHAVSDVDRREYEEGT